MESVALLPVLLLPPAPGPLVRLHFYEEETGPAERGENQREEETRLVHSHWSRNVEARLSLVESFIVLLPPEICIMP